MLHLRFPLLLLGVLLGTVGCSSTGPASSEAPLLPEASFSEAQAGAHLRFLAADELLGRRAGEPGADVAARYLAEQFRAAGLQPAPGLDGYLQPFTLPNGKTTRNVVALLEGRDPALRDEYVVLTAHYDHVGAGMRHGATAADSIFNGARDNAMGVAAVVMAAQALAAQPPARSVLFVAFGAEEMGLLGSRHFVDHSPVPLRQMVYVLNIDNGGYSDTGAVVLIGHGRTTADTTISRAAAAYGLILRPDPAPEQNLFDRSDNVAFARKGIPAPTFTAGFRAFSDPGVANYYHQVTDEADDFDFAYLTRYAQAFTGAARAIANLPEPPRWQPGDKYEEAARTLYGE